MTAAGGTTTYNQLSNVGPYTLYEVKNDSWSSAETVAISSVELPMSTSSRICIVGAYNTSTHDQVSAGTITVSYAPSTMLMTVTDSGATDDVIGVVFYIVV